MAIETLKSLDDKARAEQEKGRIEELRKQSEGEKRNYLTTLNIGREGEAAPGERLGAEKVGLGNGLRSIKEYGGEVVQRMKDSVANKIKNFRAIKMDRMPSIMPPEMKAQGILEAHEAKAQLALEGANALEASGKKLEGQVGEVQGIKEEVKNGEQQISPEVELGPVEKLAREVGAEKSELPDARQRILDAAALLIYRVRPNKPNTKDVARALLCGKWDSEVGEEIVETIGYLKKPYEGNKNVTEVLQYAAQYVENISPFEKQEKEKLVKKEKLIKLSELVKEKNPLTRNNGALAEALTSGQLSKGDIENGLVAVDKILNMAAWDDETKNELGKGKIELARLKEQLDNPKPEIELPKFDASVDAVAAIEQVTDYLVEKKPKETAEAATNEPEAVARAADKIAEKNAEEGEAEEKGAENVIQIDSKQASKPDPNNASTETGSQGLLNTYPAGKKAA